MSSREVRILLTGVSGQVGRDLLPMLQALGAVIAPTRSDLDLSSAEDIRRFVSQIKPDWIINPAAYTAVDKSESEQELAYAVNANAPRALGEAAAELGIPVIHFSTDYVFDGSGTTPWRETDATGPLGVYGASKLAGERSLCSSGAAHLIFRTSWVYGSRGKNFLLTILRLAQQKEELRIVDDQHGAPTWSRDIARMAVHGMKKLSEQAAGACTSVQEAVRAVEGVYHAADRGETTWFGFAQEFLRLAAEARPGVGPSPRQLPARLRPSPAGLRFHDA
jgi:dTDP-4-dehydrorhamnose reductase